MGQERQSLCPPAVNVTCGGPAGQPNAELPDIGFVVTARRILRSRRRLAKPYPRFSHNLLASFPGLETAALASKH